VPVFNFGVVAGTNAVEHTFILENRGDAPLTFGKVRGCCGAATSLRGKTVAPGTNTILHVKLSLRGRKGAVRKSMYVASNDPRQPYLRLQLTGSIADSFDVSPDVVDFGAISSSLVTTQTVTVTAPDAFAVTDAECRPQGFAVEVSKGSRSNTHIVTIRTVPPLPLGWSQGKVILHTDHAKTPQIELPVQATVADDSATAVGIDLPPVVIDYFYEPGCPECLEVKRDVIPNLRERYEGFYSLNRHDMGATSNVVKLVAYHKALSITNNSSVSMFVDYSRPFCGIKAIRAGLSPCLDERIEARMMPGWQPPNPIAWDADDGIGAVRKRAGGFTVSAVVIAGLIDGINPCAISTLVFFISLLVVSRVGGRGMLLMGGSFCLASFVTYTAIGFGLLRGLHMLESFPIARKAFEMALAAALLFLAFLSFRDAIRYRRSHDPHDVSVQLPHKIKMLIHGFMRRGVRSHHLVVAGLGVGAAVTALETVCTGQVYVPAMTLVIREGGNARMWGLLLLYNAMFIMPLIAAIILTRYGLTTQTMLTWSRKNVSFSKLLLGLFFLAVAVYLLLV